MWYEYLANNSQLVVKEGTYENISGIAIFNTNKTRRYFLEKRWGEGAKILTSFMMNPSNAAHNQTDDTVDQLIDVARSNGCSALYVVNVSSIIDGTSSNLTNSHFIFEKINWTIATKALTEAKIVFLGWGMKGQLGILNHQKRNSYIEKTFNKVSSKLYCYDVLKSNDKKYANKAIYYVPHPRPRVDQEKFRYMPIREITALEFVQLFIR